MFHIDSFSIGDWNELITKRKFVVQYKEAMGVYSTFFFLSGYFLVCLQKNNYKTYGSIKIIIDALNLNFSHNLLLEVMEHL